MDGDTSPKWGRRGEIRLTFFSPLSYSEDHTAEGKQKSLLSRKILASF
jgi:hypothetical protein